MSTQDLINAIQAGDKEEIQAQFEQAVSQRIADRLDAMRVDLAQTMFKEAAKCGSMDEGSGKACHPDELHVKHVGGGKYQVHAVGKNFEHGIKVGEHLSDSELDDFSEMGGKIKNVK